MTERKDYINYEMYNYMYRTRTKNFKYYIDRFENRRIINKIRYGDRSRT